MTVAPARAPVPTASAAARLGRTLLPAALLAVGAAAVVAWLFLAVFHIDDRYGVLHVQGAWMNLAAYANDGTLYPPLYDGERYGGTRWMPLPILLNAAAARVTGEYLTSGKAVGALLMAALLVLVVRELRRHRCPWPLALALPATIVATDPGRLAGTTVGGDVLPVVLQLGALVAVGRGDRTSQLAGGGVLAGLAVVSKLSAGWAVLALVSWLLANGRRRQAAVVVATAAGAFAAVAAATQLASGGRFLTGVLGLTFAGVGASGTLLRPVNQLVSQLVEFAQVTWALLPLAVVAAAVAAAGKWRRLDRYDWALAWALVCVLVVFTDVGTGFNQLIDVVVLTVVVAGRHAARLVAGPGAAPLLAAVMAAVVVWAGGTGVVTVLLPDVRAAVAAATAGEPPADYPVRPLVGVVGPGDTLLAEDPYVPLSLGRRPTVLDPFMLPRIEAVDPDAIDALVERLETGEFDYIALINPLTEEYEHWWRNFHFGPRVIGAVERSYRLEGELDGYYIYRPRQAPTSADG